MVPRFVPECVLCAAGSKREGDSSIGEHGVSVVETEHEARVYSTAGDFTLGSGNSIGARSVGSVLLTSRLTATSSLHASLITAHSLYVPIQSFMYGGAKGNNSAGINRKLWAIRHLFCWRETTYLKT